MALEVVESERRLCAPPKLSCSGSGYLPRTRRGAGLADCRLHALDGMVT